MSEDLTASAVTIKARPEFLRRGTPVRLSDGEEGVVREVYDVGALVCFDVKNVYRYTFASLHVDLTDATGRAHVDWALSKKLCAAAGGGPDHWSHTDPRLGGGYSAHGYAYDYSGVLAAIDLNDPTLLPDGSRLVDATALKLVAEHLFGILANPAEVVGVCDE